MTYEQQRRATDTLIDLWELGEEWGDEQLVRIAKDTLDKLGLPWVRMEEKQAVS